MRTTGITEDVLFESEGARTRGEIAQYLRTVADRLDGDGHLALSTGEESVDLAVPERPTFEEKAERETGSSGTELSIEFELEWDEGREGRSAGGDLTIE